MSHEFLDCNVSGKVGPPVWHANSAPNATALNKLVNQGLNLNFLFISSLAYVFAV